MTRLTARDVRRGAVAAVLLLVLVFATIGVTPWGLVAEAWRTVFATVAAVIPN